MFVIYHESCTAIQCMHIFSCKLPWDMQWSQIKKRDPRTPTPPRVMASSAMELQLGVFGVFADHTRRNKRKQNGSTIFAHCAALYASCSDRTEDAGSKRTWRTRVILISGKTWKPPIWAPCRDKDGTGSGISGLYLWQWFSNWLAILQLKCFFYINKVMKLVYLFLSLSSSLHFISQRSSQIVSGIATGGARGGRVPPLTAKKMPKIWEIGKKFEKIGKKEEKSGRKGKNHEGFFHFAPPDR